MKYVLGLALGRNASATLLAGGRIVVAIDEARLGPTPPDLSPGTRAVRYCLDTMGIDWKDVALLVKNDSRRQSESGSSNEIDIPAEVRQVQLPRDVAFAWAAAVPSNFHDTTVAVINDVAGGERSGGLFRFADGQLWPRNNFNQNGHATTTAPIFEFYREVTQYVFGSEEKQSQLVSLARRGRSGRFSGKALRMRNGTIELQRDEMAFLDPELTASCSPEPSTTILDYYADVARWAQDNIEEVTLALLTDCYRRCPSANLAYAGDLVFNTLLNGRIVTDTPFEQVCIQPLSGAPCAAAGCSFFGWSSVLGEVNMSQHDCASYYGRSYAGPPVQRAVAAAALDDSLEIGEPASLIADAVGLLGAGHTVGWYEGGSEFGPWSLGSRSLLADPRLVHDEAHAEVNGHSRPFTIAVLAERCAELFEVADVTLNQPLPARIRPGWRESLSALTGSDSRVLVQCVSNISHPGLHKLLSAWLQATGTPLLINRPMAEPFVETPQQAIDLVQRNGLDALVLEQYLIRKRRPS